MSALWKRTGGIYRLLLVAITILFIMMAIAIIAAAIWFFIERNYMSSVVQSDLFTAGSIILFICGFAIFIVSFIGCMGAYKGSRCPLYTYAVTNIIVLLLTLCGAIVAGAFNAEIQTVLKENMEATLVNRYGNNTHNNTINNVVTEAWDRMQVRLQCCAVQTEGWEVWQASSWYQYKVHNNYEIAEIELVPVSCCERASFDWELIINQYSCQTTQGGPPATRIGSPNHFLHKTGCYDAAKDALSTVVWVLFCLGLFLVIMIVGGIVSAICLVKRIRREEKYGKSSSRGRSPQGQGRREPPPPQRQQRTLQQEY